MERKFWLNYLVKLPTQKVLSYGYKIDAALIVFDLFSFLAITILYISNVVSEHVNEIVENLDIKS